ncbi:peptidoglycan-binding protein [Luteibacter sp. CQ10]|uniref:peptidoglycan-binding protein n=1 Tax=Luteibacter sp. CQ10 TaxID=2805821 RepID=UPI0034A48273
MPRLNESAAFLLREAIESGITSPVELANLMANASVETRKFSVMHESFGYASVDRLLSAASSAIERFTREEIQSAIDSRDPRRIATVMYERRPSLENSEPGDGWKFRGRGYFQLTGRHNYRVYGGLIGVDLISNPDAAADPKNAAKISLLFWRENRLGRFKDAISVGAKLNGGKNGENERYVAGRQWASILTEDLIRDIRSGAISAEQLAQIETDFDVVAHSGHSPELMQVQQNLNELGYTDKHNRALTVDGDDGVNTRAAVEKFQRDHGLTVNGRADPSVQAVVREAVETKRRSFGLPDAPYLRQGEPDTAMSMYRSFAPGPVPGLAVTDDALIRSLQQNLNTLGIADMKGEPLEVHGVYDISTQAAVARFQRTQGLEVTGQPDERTRSLLHGQAFIAELKQLPQAPVVEPTPWADPAPRAQRQPSLAPPEPEPMRFSDPKHPQNALYRELKRMLPEKTKEDRVAQITAACYEGGIKPGRIGTFEIKDDRIEVFGALTGYADVDLLQRPAEQESLERVQSFDRQQMQELAQLQAQRQEASLGPAMVR